MYFRPSPTTWRCEDCLHDERLWRERGYCEQAPTELVGALEGKIEAVQCVHHRAEHLGGYEQCPIALIRAAQPLIEHVCQAYALCRRLGVHPATEDAPLLLALDEEIKRIEELEAEDARKRAELQRRASRGKV